MPTRPEASDSPERLDMDASLQEQDTFLTLTNLFSLPLEFYKMGDILVFVFPYMYGVGGSVGECIVYIDLYWPQVNIGCGSLGAVHVHF